MFLSVGTPRTSPGSQPGKCGEVRSLDVYEVVTGDLKEFPGSSKTNQVGLVATDPRTRFLQDVCLQFSLQSWSTEAAAEVHTQGHNLTSSGTSGNQDQQCSYPSGEAHFLSEIHKKMEQALKQGVLRIQMYLKQCHTGKGRLDSNDTFHVLCSTVSQQ